ncbi:MAG: peptidoglycan-binding protein [bacterium]|nr:peptidoglycan-binding protein [bacterium]
MRKTGKYVVMILTAWTILFGLETICNVPITQLYIEAHSGRTDSSGGHKDNRNKSGLGSYHYHCGGNPAHLHSDGACPYAAGTESKATSTAAATSDASGTTKNKVSKSDIKKVQEALNFLGYDCGTPDGTCGKTTKKRIKEYQEDMGVTVDGVIDAELLEALGV